ncbi:hypothetical protein [Cobetia marina]|uniref:hypothetical protein n=1 Tax=Cobetia marina TaxID=28258 RepID=UPI0011413D7B|nr:hypothetical protein [Cobetia marina]GED44121.1 hypothetical protein HHA02_34500 [Cobetia marina]
MRKLGTADYVSLLLIVPFSIYFISMIVYPFVHGDWDYVQSVWSRWQGLNVGVLAFISSVILFSAARYNSEKQREREFVASMAFLPASHNELVEYLKRCANYYKLAWEGDTFDLFLSAPLSHRDVFQNCIRHANPEVGAYMVEFLSNLQLIDARMQYINEYGTAPDLLMEDFLLLGELKVMVDKILCFSRGEITVLNNHVTWNDYYSAYTTLGVSVHSIFTKNKGSLKDYVIKSVV